MIGFFYVATISWPSGYVSDEQRGGWLTAIEDAMRAAYIDATDETLPANISFDGEGGSVAIAFHENLNLTYRKGHLLKVADKLTWAAHVGASGLPSPWVTRHRGEIP